MDTSAKLRLVKIIDRIATLVEKCGGPGSGVPGPCPSTHSGGGTGGGGHRRSAAEHSEMKEIHRNYPPANKRGLDTDQQYRRPDGKYTDERHALHNKIIEDFLKHATPVPKPESHMMGGGPASGKSVAQKSGKMNIPKNIVTIDADEVKAKLPEYGVMLKHGNAHAAAFCHEESSYLSKRILKEATKRSYNTMLDGTGNSSVQSVLKKVDIMRKDGRKVSANYVTCDTETAVQRNIERAKKTGRLPPEAMLRACHKSVSKVVPELIKMGAFDKFNLFDTNHPSGAVHVASAEGTKLTIHNQELWDRFIAKGHDAAHHR